MADEIAMREQFEKFDMDKSGEISTRELVCVVLALGKTEEQARAVVTYILKEFDKNEDMKITWDEFKTGWTKKYGSS